MSSTFKKIPTLIGVCHGPLDIILKLNNVCPLDDEVVRVNATGYRRYQFARILKISKSYRKCIPFYSKKKQDLQVKTFTESSQNFVSQNVSVYVLFCESVIDNCRNSDLTMCNMSRTPITKLRRGRIFCGQRI